MKIIIYIFLLFLPHVSLASDCSIDKVGTKIFYANGMFNDANDHYLSIRTLEQKLRKAIPVNNGLKPPLFAADL
ncbi:hypothetical protein L3Q72_07565 [Vibrio sp. JC009]|uniref:hypothetical protein n=1 Tax=Vibrio sp. JC009 TaxID=2912314 RepID=UPI0023B124C6|nr:hypothetical protein [Vibrio sp. JC009]WED23239.1 hypothetical protein L3Q72_07565 [Vibrio sp. JC009]